MPDDDISILRPENPVPRALSSLVSEFRLDTRGSCEGVELSGITLDSRTVMPGDIFVGLRGANQHGATRSVEAKRRGAVAVLTDSNGAQMAADSGLPIVIADSPRELLGRISSWVFGTTDAAALMLAVTGTNGKTSVSYLIHGILGQLGIISGLSTTAERMIGSVAVTSTLTTPEATEIHGLLARMREHEVGAVVLEVSAQALTQRRIDGLFFDVVGFLNLSRDHLDDYATMDDYFEAKLPLFFSDRARRAVISLDTHWGQRVVEACQVPVTTVSSDAAAGADWTVAVVAEFLDFTEFRLTAADGRTLSTRVAVIGRHMAANAAVAIVMLTEAGITFEEIAYVLERDGGITARIPGRVERISGSSGPALFVDYGHSPDAFSATLAAVRRVTPGRLIMVFGADGDRDSGKREEMGHIGSEDSDVHIITDYNPRFENPEAIRAALLAGAATAENPAEVYEVAAQGDAIRLAVSLAREGDAILWAGPGHENYIDVRGEKLPFTARDEARAALRGAGWA